MASVIVVAALALNVGTATAQKKDAAKSTLSYYSDGGMLMFNPYPNDA